MAVVISNVKKNREGRAVVTYFDVTGPASYTTGGEVLTAAQQAQILPEAGVPPAANFAAVDHFVSERTPAGLQCVLDKANNKMMIFAAGAEAGSGSNQSGVVIRCKATDLGAID